MKIKNPETGEVIVIPQGMEDSVRDAIESGNDPIEAMQMKYGGIHINPANKGKFNATKKATGKTTEELTHSKNPLTRKRAIFSQNASRWKHQDGGQAMQQQQPQQGGQQDQMQQLVQMAEQALAQGTPPEEVAQMLVQQGVPEQVVQQVIQYAIQDLQQQAQGQNPEEQMQQQNPQEEQAEMGYGGMGMYEEGGMSMYSNGGQLPESLLRTRMKASGATSEEINNYLTENYNYGGMTMYGHGGMIKRADGSYSKRGLWDNIRANKGSGRAPTKEMLEQESKIRAKEAAYGGAYGNGGGIDNPGFRALPTYVQQDIINNMAYGGRFLRKAQFGTYDDNSSYRDNPNDPNSSAYNNFTATNAGQPNQYQEEVQMDKMPLTSIQSGSTGNNLYGYDKANPLPSNMDKVNPVYPMQYHGKNYDTSTPSKTNNKNSYNYNSPSVGGSGYFNRGINNLNSAANSFIKGSQIKRHGGLHRMDPGGLALSSTSSNATWGQGLGNLGTGTSFTSPPPTAPIDGFQMDPNQIQDPNQAQEQLPLDNTVLPQNQASSQKPNGMYKWAAGIGKAFSNNNVNYGKGALKATKGLEDLSKGTVEIFGNNISNRNALGDEANNLRSAMRNDYQRTGKRPTDGNAIISKYGGRMMQDGGATYADKMKVSKNSPEADFIAEKGEYIVNNGVASKLETGGSHASGNDTAISLDKSSNPSYVLSDTPRLKQLQFGGKRVSPSKYAEMATVEELGKTPDQILKAYTAFTKRAGTEGKVFGDRISDATNQLLAQKYQKDLATVKQIADQAYHKQEQLKHAMGMDNDLNHAQEVNGMSMAKSGGMQDGVHMNYFNAPAVQYGGSPQLFSDPSGLGYNTTQMAYGGLHKMQTAGKAPPVYLSDPNDPRIRMYSDSLAQFNTTKPFINEINRQNRTGVYDERKLAQLQANNMRSFSGNPLYDFRGNVIGNSPTSKLSKNTKNMYPTSNRTLNTSIHTKRPMTDAEYEAAVRDAFEAETPQASEDLQNRIMRVDVEQPWRVDSYQEPTNPYLYRPERDKEEEIDLPTMGNVGTNQQISQPISNIPTVSAPRKDYVTITDGQGRRNPETGAFESQTYKIDRVTGKRISEPEFTKQNGGMYRIAGGGNASNTTRQQSKIDYDKQYGVKTNTGDVGVDKYADIQNKSKIGFGKAEENLKSFSQWKDIYPGYNDLMTEVNKKGGPGKDNPKVGTFQTWMNKDYIPQQVEKLNTERTAAGYPAYDATQLGQLKTDLINDFGFDDTTGQRVDSDFGAYTSSRTPINFSFNKKEEEKKKEEPPVVKGDEPVVPKLSIDKEEEEPYYDYPAINAFIPQPYGRNPIGLAQAKPQTIRPAKLNIQPELNEYNRGIRGAFRGTQGNTSVDVAQQMQGLNNLYGAQNKLYGQKYNFDEQSRMGAEQFNAQAIMNTDAGNLQRIGAQQDLINRREGILDTQRRTDFQAGIENADKQNAYGLSKEFINKNFSPLSNSGNMYIYDPSRVTPVEKEKSYTKSQWEKKIADEKKATEGKKYGGSLKKIKLKLRK